MNREAKFNAILRADRHSRLHADVLALDAALVSASEPLDPASFEDPAMQKLAAHIVEDLSGVEARWLHNVIPFFTQLIAKAQETTIGDADFVLALQQAAGACPELFGALNTEQLATALEKAMGAALVNGAIRGYTERHGKESSVLNRKP